VEQIEGGIFITGETRSVDFPIKQAFQATFAEGTSDAFILNLSASGDSVLSSTYLGGDGIDIGYDIAGNSADSLYCLGKTASEDFPLQDPYQGSLGGSWDSFVSKLDWICYSTTPSPPPTPSPSPTPQGYTSPTPAATPSVTPSITPAPTLTPVGYDTPTPTPVPESTPIHLVIDFDDYNGDGYTDYALYRSSTGEWFIKNVTEGVVWGGSEGDIPASGDYNGDGTADIAYYNKYASKWYVLNGIGPDIITSGLSWGNWGDWPIPGDYDGDGSTDYAVWDLDSTGRWVVLGEAEPYTEWGLPGDIPVPGDYNGDGTADKAVWRESNGKWYVRGGTPVRTSWGFSGNIPMPLDYDGDGITDFATFWPQPTSTAWFFVKDFGKYEWGWGYKEDLPVIGNFQSPALAAEFGIFRTWCFSAGTGGWFIYGGSPVLVETEGESGDIPVVGQSY